MPMNSKLLNIVKVLAYTSNKLPVGPKSLIYNYASYLLPCILPLNAVSKFMRDVAGGSSRT